MLCADRLTKKNQDGLKKKKSRIADIYTYFCAETARGAINVSLIGFNMSLVGLIIVFLSG